METQQIKYTQFSRENRVTKKEILLQHVQSIIRSEDDKDKQEALLNSLQRVVRSPDRWFWTNE